MPATRGGVDLALIGLVTLFFGFAALWAWRIPIPVGRDLAAWGNFNPDEGIHIKTILFMAAHHRLAPHTPDYAVTLHPPLYHFLAAAVYAATAPLVGTVSALRVVRLLSCVMGSGVVWLTYRAARLLASRPTSLLAAGLVAGVPMFVSLSAEATNENLSTLSAAGALYVMIRGLRHGFDMRRTLSLAAWVAVGIGTKLTCLGLLPAAWFALWWEGRLRGRAGVDVVRQMAIVLGLTLLLDGWWFVRNQVLYGFPIKATQDEAQWSLFQPGYAQYHAFLGWGGGQYLYFITATGWESFWGKFDGQSRPIPDEAYGALALFQAVSCLGLRPLGRQVRLLGERAIIAGTVALFALTVVVIYYGLNWRHATPQGRYFFPLLLPFGLCLASGWRAAFTPALRGVVSWSLWAGLLLLNLYCFVVYSHP